MELHIPKLREGSYFPSLLEPRRRSERALLAVIQQAYVEGVSTRRVDDLVKALGCEGISKSQVSRICQELDVVVDGFLGRPLDGGPYPYLWLDALTQKVREDGRIVNVSVVVATAVNGEGKREIIGMDVGTSEDGAFWLAFLRSLSARGLSGVELVVSDAHQGLRGAIAAVFGGASWQRCRTHFMTNLLTRVPRRVQPWMATMVRTILRAQAMEWWQDFPEGQLLTDLYRRDARRRAKFGSRDSRRRASHTEGLCIARLMLADLPDVSRFDSEWELESVSKVLAVLFFHPIGAPSPKRLQEYIERSPSNRVHYDALKRIDRELDKLSRATPLRLSR